MRFRFNGFHRETGNPVAGYVEASDTEAAYQVLSAREIVTETLRDDPKPASAAADVEATAVSQFADALENALDQSSSQVPFDDLTKRYRGKKVWVVDREKIRQRVTQVVDSTLADEQSDEAARERVADAIDGLFNDNRNIASEHNAESIAKMRKAIGAAKKNAAGDGDLSEQIGRLTGVVEQAEGLIHAMQAALRNVETGGSAPRRHAAIAAPSFSLEQNGVLREIFESNLQLRRAMQTSVKA